MLMRLLVGTLWSRIASFNSAGTMLFQRTVSNAKAFDRSEIMPIAPATVRLRYLFSLTVIAKSATFCEKLSLWQCARLESPTGGKAACEALFSGCCAKLELDGRLCDLWPGIGGSKMESTVWPCSILWAYYVSATLQLYRIRHHAHEYCARGCWSGQYRRMIILQRKNGIKKNHGLHILQR